MAKPKPSKYSRARIRSKVRKPKRAGASRGWMISTLAIAAVGVLLIVLSYQDRQSLAQVAPKLGDHFHAYLGVSVCGKWEPAVPMFEGRDGSADQNATPKAGIHSHADFLIHDHPFASDEAGKKATLGKYLSYAQSELSDTSIKLWSQWAPNVSYRNGQKCPGAKVGSAVQWKVGALGKPWPTKPHTGNPADYRMRNGDIIAIYFAPKGDQLEQPPGSDDALKSISDLNGQSALPSSSTTGSSSSAPAGDSSSSTVPAATASSTSVSSSPAGSTSSSKP